MEKKFKILFVCLGNICRSPAAEAVMQKFVNSAGMADKISVSSCGLIDYHSGEPADSRMIEACERHGYKINHLARKIAVEDFSNYDLIVGMDGRNISKLQSICPKEGLMITKISSVAQFFEKNIDKTSVLDPYYGTEKDFENVIVLLEDACNGILKFVKEKL